MDFSVQEMKMGLASRVLAGDVQAAARLISQVEDEVPGALEEMNRIYPHTGKAYIVGVTGSPGAGKSTLTDNLIGFFREKGMTVGVIAIDPTSALTGGAILGDRDDSENRSLPQDVGPMAGNGRSTAGELLGEQIGIETVEGVKVGLYVLQAEPPERETPTSPAHLISVTLLDRAGGEVIKDAMVSIVAQGEGEKEEEIPLTAVKAWYQGSARLRERADYSMKVEFEAGELAGTATFKYPGNSNGVSELKPGEALVIS